MSGFLLDTNVISELRKRRPNQGLLKWLEDVSEPALFLSSVTLGELRMGVELLADAKKRQDLERWLVSGVAERFRGRVLAFDDGVADRWGRLEAQARLDGARLPAVDAMLAATAIHHNLTLVTRNDRDFRRTGVPLTNPWQ